MSLGVVMGIDYGSKRIGLALSDSSQRLAVPLEVIPAKSALEHIVKVCRQRDCVALVIGLPLNLDGGRGKIAHAAMSFAGRLAKALPSLEIIMHDERFSSRQVDSMMESSPDYAIDSASAPNPRKAGSAKRAKKEVKGAFKDAFKDALAAQVILENWLAARKNQKNNTEKTAGTTAQ